MRILAIETSCDETAVCVFEGQGDLDFGMSEGGHAAARLGRAAAPFSYHILGNALRSQASLHAQYGGVFPNLAKNEHSEHIVPLLTQALTDANLLEEGLTSLKKDIDFDELLAHESALREQLPVFLRTHARPDIDIIAVTAGPGLEPALWVGVNTARALSLAWGIPLVAVNHMEGHVLASLIENGAARPAQMPAISLLVSGGHTELILMKGVGEYEYLGRTRDDAAGEAFDKIARMLGLPYPGGPEISRLATQARSAMGTIAPKGGTLQLPRPMISTSDYDFSFAGLKTAASKLIEAHQPLTDDMRPEIARETEDAIVDVLVTKTMRAAEEYSTHTILVGGGVSANAHLKQEFARAIEKHYATEKLLEGSLPTIPVYFPGKGLSTDNAIMIALAGYTHAVKKEFADARTLSANGSLRLS